MNNQYKFGLIATFLSAVIWGLTFISTKVLIAYLDPILISFFKCGLATIFLFSLMKFKKKKISFDHKDIPRIIISGIAGVVLYGLLLSIALKSIPASLAGLLNGAIPIFTLLIEVLLFSKKVSIKFISAFLLSTLGIYFTILDLGPLLNGTGMLAGIFIMFVAILAWIVYTFMTAPLSSKYDSLSVLAGQILAGTIFLLPMAIVKINQVDNIFKVLANGTVLLHVLYLGIFCSGLAYYLFAYGMDIIGNSKASLSLNLIPVVSIIGSYFMLGELISFNKLIGLLLVIGSILLTNVSFDKKATLEPEFQSNG